MDCNLYMYLSFIKDNTLPYILDSNKFVTVLIQMDMLKKILIQEKMKKHQEYNRNILI